MKAWLQQQQRVDFHAEGHARLAAALDAGERCLTHFVPARLQVDLVVDGARLD